jgi:hypothetical protein
VPKATVVPSLNKREVKLSRSPKALRKASPEQREELIKKIKQGTSGGQIKIKLKPK